MKVYKSTHEPVVAAKIANVGTTWYRVTLKQFSDFIEDHESNLFIRYTALTNNFDALNLSQMYGSAVYDDELFICETNGQPIVVGPDADVDPETAFENYTPEDLHAYIEDAKTETLIKYITYREIKPELLEEDQVDAAIDALETRQISIEDLIKDYNEIW